MPWLDNVEYAPPVRQAYKRALCPFCGTWQPLVGEEGHNPDCAARYFRSRNVALFIRVQVINKQGTAVFAPPRKKVAVATVQHVQKQQQESG